MPNAVTLQPFRALRAISATAVTVLLALPHCEAAATTSTVASDRSATPPLSTASQPTSATAGPHRIVVLVGDQPTVVRSGRAPKAVDLKTLAATTLGAEVIDRTQPGTTVAAVQAQAPQIVALKPEVVLLLAGPPASLASSPDSRQTASLQGFSRAVTGAGAKVIILPASTAVGAAEAAVLQIDASGAGSGVHYVDLGGELAGRPFEEALEEARRILEAPAATPAPPTPAEPTPPASPTPAPQPTVEGAPQPSGTKEMPASPLPPALTGTPEPAAKPQPAMKGDRLRMTGPEATSATINMRPPAPLKEFSPRRPAPNKPNEKKEPSFAR